MALSASDIILGFEFGIDKPNLSLLEKVYYQEEIAPLYLGITPALISDLPSTQKYLYFVSALLPQIFHQNLPPLSEKIKADVDSGRAHVLWYQPYEGGSGLDAARDYRALEDWIARSNIDPKKVHLLHAQLLPLDTQFNLHPVHSFETWIPRTDGLPEYNGKKIFLNYNRVPRPHRILFVAMARANNLLKYGHVSFNTADTRLHKLDGFSAHLQPHVEWLQHNRLVLDTDTTENLADTLFEDHYADTLFSVVSETLVQSNCLFLSEKVWKPISVGHPFMTLGNPGTLRYLKERGYKTFDRFWDERYDNDLPIEERVSLILGEIKRLSYSTRTERLALSQEMRETCEYNKHLFYQQIHDKYGTPVDVTRAIVQTLFHIWESF